MKPVVFNTPTTQRSFIPLLIIGCSITLFFLLYTQPFQSLYSIDATAISATGLYPFEQNEQYSYAYTRGQSEITIPSVGNGWFATSLRMAGPQGNVPVSASIRVNDLVVTLGVIDQGRVFHFMFPSTDGDSVHLRLLSTTTKVPNDSRNLGVLLDWVAVESLGTTAPPASSFLWLGGALCIIWIGALQLPVSSRWRYILLVCSGVLLSFILGLLRTEQAPLIRYVLWGSVLFTSAILLLTQTSALWPRIRPGLQTKLSARRFSRSRFSAALHAVTPVFIVWRLGIWAVAALSLWFSPRLYALFPSKVLTNDTWHRGELIDGRAMWYSDEAPRLNFVRKVLVDSWLQWDGHRYVWIAIRGAYEYDIPQPNIAFFPLYPLLTRGMMVLTGGDAVIAAMLVSQIALYAGLLLLYDLVATDFSAALGRRTVLCLLLFPTAVFLGAIFTESLAIAFAVAAIWAMRRERWWLAGLAGFFLALCRLPGILIAPVIALTYLQRRRWRWRAMMRPSFLASGLPVLGLGVFMAYQWYMFGTPFAFFIAQKDWNNETSPPWVLPMAIFRAFGNTANLPLELLQLVAWAGFIGLSFLASRWLPLPYTLTMLFILLPPYLSSWHRSFSRYVLPAFPAFIVIAMLCERRWVRSALLAATMPFLLGAIVLFVNGFWMG